MRGIVLAMIAAVAWDWTCLAARAETRGEGSAIWQTACRRAEIFEDCGRHALRLLHGWIDLKQDPKTGLFSRGGVWNYHNEAADHYSSLVLIAHYVDPPLIAEGGALQRTLHASRTLCVTPSGIPATYDLRRGVPGKPAGYGALAEWLRDGLIRIAEILGTGNDWYAEMQRLVDAMIANAGGSEGFPAAIPDAEVQGNMLQTLARLRVMSGDDRYLAAAEAIADQALLGAQPLEAFLTFRDHGCELVPGLGELFVLECKLKRPKAEAYRAPLGRLLDGIRAEGAHPTSGLFCNSQRMPDGSRRWHQPPDTWGYVLFAYENYDRGTGEGRYRLTIERPLAWLVSNRKDFADLRTSLWPRSTSSDDWSDSYESMIVLASRAGLMGGAFEWLDWATLQHEHRRDLDPRYGPYTGGHFDGSTGRTLCMHMMLCSQGVRAVPFCEGLRVGAVAEGERLALCVACDKPWRGKLVFDGPRCDYGPLKLDWARINEMPQWFVARPGRSYRLRVDRQDEAKWNGAALIAGLPLEVGPDATRKILVEPM